MRKTWLWTAVALVAIAGGSYALYLLLQPPRLLDQVLYGNGRIEGTEVRMSAEVGGRVVESSLQEGTTIAAGAALVTLDDTDFTLRRDRVAAEIEALRAERARAVSELEVARHHSKTAESDLTRYQALSDKGTVTPQRLEQAENASREAKGHVAATEAGIGAIDGRIEATRKELDLVANQIAKTRLLAPITGTVVAKALETGEVVQPGQTVAVIVDLSRIELKVFLPEGQIGKVALGSAARVRVDAFPDRLFEGRVARVDQHAQFTPRDIHMPQERTRTVFGVTLALDNPDQILKPGMPADAWILWRPDAGWPEKLFVPG